MSYSLRTGNLTLTGASVQILDQSRSKYIERQLVAAVASAWQVASRTVKQAVAHLVERPRRREMARVQDVR